MKIAGSAPEPPHRPARLRFGPFLLDLERRSLARGDERLRLTPKPFDTLVFLVENRGRAVAKQELLDAVWRGTAVTEGTLVQAIREVRRVLDDDKDAPVFVATVPREGYRFVGPVTVEPESEAPAPGRRVWPALAAACALAAAATAVWIWLARTTSPRLRSDSLQQISSGQSSMKPAFSPDGRLLAFVAAGAESPGVFDLFVQPTGGGSARRLTVGADAAGDMPAFTADGGALVFGRYRDGGDGTRLSDLWRVSAAGGTPEPFVAEATGAGFSPDGRLVAYTRRGHAGAPLCLAPLAEPQRCREEAPLGFTPRFSRDGRWLAYTTSDPEGGPGELWVAGLPDGPALRLAGPRTQMYGLAWLHDSSGVIAAEERAGSFQLWLHLLDGSAPTLLTTGPGGFASPTLAADGSVLAFCHTRGTQDLHLAPLGGGEGRALTSGEYHQAPRLSPAARSVLSLLSWAGQGEVLRLTDLGPGAPRSLARGVLAPAWLDERHVAWAVRGESGRDVVRELDLQDGSERDLARLEGQVLALALHPDGPQIAAVLNRADGSQELRRFSLVTGGAVVLSGGLTYDHPAFSPDGRRLAWSGPLLAGDARSNGVWLCGVLGGEPRRVAPDGHGPVWSSDGSGLYFSRTLGPAENTGLFLLDLTSGHERRLRAWRRVPAFDVAGDTLVFTPEAGDSQIYSLGFAR